MGPFVSGALAALVAASAQPGTGGPVPLPAPPAIVRDPPLIAPATIDEGLEVEGEAVKARQIRTRMAVAVTVDGQGPFRFIVDTGADRSVIGQALARRLALPAGPAVMLHGMAGTQQVDTVAIATLEVGVSRISGIVAPALPEAYLGAQGLIGLDALAGQRLMLDFERKTISVEDPASRAPPADDEIVVTARRRFGQLILTQVNVGGRRVHAVIDTGAEVTMGNSALRALVFGGRKPPPPHPVLLTSVTGQQVTADLVVLPSVRIGALAMEGVPIAFADVRPFALFGLADTPAMLLGTDLLEAFRRVSLDFSKRKVRFQLRR
ncbi:MAG TPA: retroviral-like aspartic protease family protein [Sphingomonadaceae bacterium]|jgi:predicted aspartyl protease|nr:retroviral-like aspartic protease family protein [Sphingomonadaceae bacterium]